MGEILKKKKKTTASLIKVSNFEAPSIKNAVFL